VLQRRFDYIFRQNEIGSGVLYRPFLAARVLNGPFEINGLSVKPFRQQHGMGNFSTGYRLGAMAYSTDVVGLDEAAFGVLAGLDLWIVDCLRFEPHPTHAHFDLVLLWIDRLRPKRTILTHMNHTLDYDEIARLCPPGVEPAYDGLAVELDD
jgi:phosphoribosyl 1,2-cyclic phosphate phosphodiesterase